jgi:hypothetical protein
MLVTLMPEAVDYQAFSPLRRGLKEHGTFACTPATSGRPWEAACAALTDFLADGMRRRVRLGVVLSDRLARYQLLSWQAGIVTRADWRAYAMNRFEAVYGEAARSWRLKIDLVPPGTPSLACAIDGDLIDALRGVAATNLSRLISVRPNYLSVFSQRRHALRGNALWFGVVEQRHVCLGVLSGQTWRAIRNEGAADGWQAALPGMIRRIECTLDEPPPAVLHLGGDLPSDALPEAIGGLSVRRLELRSPRARQAAQRAVAAGS